MKNDDASFECRVATGRKNWTSKVVRSVVCLKSDLQPNSCWFQFFSFSRAQGGLEVYYGHICPGNSTKNSIFVYSRSFSNECKITKLVHRCGVPRCRGAEFLFQKKIVLPMNDWGWELKVRRDWISHACYSFWKFLKTQHNRFKCFDCSTRLLNPGQ